MNRRTFLCGLTLGMLAAPLAAEAEPTGKVYRVGVLSEGPRSSVIDLMLPPALHALGWVESENFVFERRHAEGKPDQLPKLAEDLVRAKPDLILAVGNPETAAAKRATSSIPIVMMFGLQPIETGLVPSLARPGGNVTGMVWVTPVYAGKILEVFKEAIPKATTIALLWDPTNPGLLLRFVQSWSGPPEYLMWRSAMWRSEASRTSMGRSRRLSRCARAVS